MDPALTLLDKALKGDTGSLLFLERVASIYVFDGTDANHPVIGIWDFLHQAISEVERYEALYGRTPDSLKLDAHVQMLGTMSRKSARRSPREDQKLVEVCLTNAAAASFKGSNEYALQLIQQNHQNRTKVMGRIVALIFDFTNHRPSTFHTAFSNLVAMDTLCALVAANTIATGPQEFSKMILDWILPMFSNLPSFSVASVVYHLAVEVLGKEAPAGSLDMLRNVLFEPCITKILAPMLFESVGDNEIEGSHIVSHPSVAMTIKAIEKWCAAAGSSILRLKQICHSVNINIVSVISDVMYSDSEIVIDALSEMLETLLGKHLEDENALVGFTGSKVFLNQFEQMNAIQCLENKVASDILEREAILSELVSAIGLQRFKFKFHLADDNAAVCRCLSLIARSITQAAHQLIKSGKLQGIEKGLIDLLHSAAMHRNICVYSIALDGLKFVLTRETAPQLLIILQGKAILPTPLITESDVDNDIDIDFHEFERFREHQLADFLNDCYVTYRSFYIESCCVAIEEFCSSHPDDLIPYQLEAAMFCLTSVSVNATKRALLVSASPAAKLAAGKACYTQHPNASILDVQSISEDASKHDAMLTRCLLALNSAPATACKNSFFLSQLSRFLGNYAHWIAKSPTSNVIEIAVRLTFGCFNEILNRLGDYDPWVSIMEVSPFTEITSALRNILSRAPDKFANLETLTILENGWKVTYASNQNINSYEVNLNDRKSLCEGISKVLAELPSENWCSSLSMLIHPTIERMELIVRNLHQIKLNGISDAYYEKSVITLSDELHVLASALRSFNQAASKSADYSIVTPTLFSILHKVWPCITQISKLLFDNQTVVSSLSEFLQIVISLNHDFRDTSILKEACDVAMSILDAISENIHQSDAAVPIFEFIDIAIDVFGHIAEKEAANITKGDNFQHIFLLTQDLIRKCFDTAKSATSKTEEYIPGIFSVFRSAIRRCPTLFAHLHVDGGESIFVSSINDATSVLACRQSDVIREAMLYLYDTFHFVSQKSEPIMIPYRSIIIRQIIAGSCGSFPREVLDPAGNLLYIILANCEVSEKESICNLAMESESCSLDEQVKMTILHLLGQCGNKSAISASKVMDMLDDIWMLSQQGSIGGDAILSFTLKYSEYH